MVEKLQRQIETIERFSKPISFKNKTTAKSMASWLQVQINSFIQKDNKEMEFIFREVLNAYNYYHPVKTLETEVDSWKGKSSFELIKGIDKLTIIKFQRKSRWEEPTQIKTEVSKDELIALVDALKRVNSLNNIRTEKIALIWSEILNLGHSSWSNGSKPFFSDRPIHNKFTLMLSALDKLGLIQYKSGKTTILGDLNLEGVFLK